MLTAQVKKGKERRGDAGSLAELHVVSLFSLILVLFLRSETVSHTVLIFAPLTK